MKIIIGHDRYGKELSEGDICEYAITDQNGITNRYKGMIEYDPTEYAYLFNQLEADFPAVLMNKVNRGTIKKICHIYGIDNDFPDYNEWIKIFAERFSTYNI